MPSSRRLLITIPLLLLAGAVVNIAFAWGIAGLGRAPMLEVNISYTNAPEGETMEFSLGVDGRASSPRPAPWHIGLERAGDAFASIRSGFGQWYCAEMNFRGGQATATAAFGWPFPALRARVPTSFGGAPAARPLRAPAFLTSRGMFAASDGAIPIDPVAPGVVWNSLIYTAALTPTLMLIPLRERFRRRRGRCPKCNYDMIGIQGSCPECGNPR